MSAWDMRIGQETMLAIQESSRTLRAILREQERANDIAEYREGLISKAVFLQRQEKREKKAFDDC